MMIESLLQELYHDIIHNFNPYYSRCHLDWRTFGPGYRIIAESIKEPGSCYYLFFESSFEWIGIPALFLQVITGFYLVHYYASDVSQLQNLDLHIGRVFMVKLSCLLVIILLAAHVRFRVIPNLDNDNLRYLAVHIIAVTIVSVVFVIAGLNFRTGYFF